jgi:hypothetical protein
VIPARRWQRFNVGGTRQLYLNNEIEVPIIKAPYESARFVVL